ncbi:uncharacterized protein L199_008617 [Kwoniella botswanensis]|uniref:uncharacterized protein n=1 Tax=Kwoniella botswanensis TaxID=1268659 RepID=UPI00315D7CE9
MSIPVNQSHPTWLEVLSRALASAPNPKSTYSADRSRFPPTQWCDPTFYRRTVYRPDTPDQAGQPSMSQEDFLKVRQGLQIPDYQRIKLDHDASYLEISYNIQERSLTTPISDLPPEHRPSELVEHEAKGMMRVDSEYTWDGQFALHTLNPNQCQQLDCLGWTEKDIEDPTLEHDSSKTRGIFATDGVFGSGLAMLWKCNRIKTPSRFTKNDLINNADHYDHSGLVDLSKKLNSYDFRSTLYIYRPLRDPYLPIKSFTNKYNDRINTWLTQDHYPSGNLDLSDDKGRSELSPSQTSSFSSSRYFDETDE